YDTGPPTGVIAFPQSSGATLLTSSYTVVVRADSSVNAVEFTIADSLGQTNGLAALVAPDPTLTQQYPNYPQQFRFDYNNIPTNGIATIVIRLKKLTSSVLANRVTKLVRIVTTRAPAGVLQITRPAQDREILVLDSNVIYSIQACFSSDLTADSNLFSIYINGVFQP